MFGGMVMQNIELTTKQAGDLEEFLEYHYYNLFNYLNDEDDVSEGWEPYGPYDGCTTCETRENLMAIFTWLRENNIVDIYVK
jgi:hypothetical protein